MIGEKRGLLLVQDCRLVRFFCFVQFDCSTEVVNLFCRGRAPGSKNSDGFKLYAAPPAEDSRLLTSTS